LASLKNQTFQDFSILVMDNTETEDNENKKFIKENYPEIDFEWAGSNLGFSRAYNKLIAKSLQAGAEYFLMLNPDMILEPNAVEEMLKVLESRGDLGSVSPKVLSWDFENNEKTNFIDTCGILLKSGLRFIDAGQGLVDDGSFDSVDILGPSGAAGLFRLQALEKIKKNDQYFDQAMFMYKEDCDLAYRLFLAGFKSVCAGQAVVYHDRTARARGQGDVQVALNRKNKSRLVKEWSFTNQHIIFLKYWRLQDWRNRLAILFFACKMFVFVLFFERYLLKCYKEAWRKSTGFSKK